MNLDRDGERGGLVICESIMNFYECTRRSMAEKFTVVFRRISNTCDFCLFVLRDGETNKKRSFLEAFICFIQG